MAGYPKGRRAVLWSPTYWAGHNHSEDSIGRTGRDPTSRGCGGTAFSIRAIKIFEWRLGKLRMLLIFHTNHFTISSPHTANLSKVFRSVMRLVPGGVPDYGVQPREARCRRDPPASWKDCGTRVQRIKRSDSRNPMAGGQGIKAA